MWPWQGSEWGIYTPLLLSGGVSESCWGCMGPPVRASKWPFWPKRSPLVSPGNLEVMFLMSYKALRSLWELWAFLGLAVSYKALKRLLLVSPGNRDVMWGAKTAILSTVPVAFKGFRLSLNQPCWVKSMDNSAQPVFSWQNKKLLHCPWNWFLWG